MTDVFKSLRPDIVLVGNHNIVTLELTICHESNLLRSRQYKCDRYKDIALDLRNQYANFQVKSFTIEVTTLGFISDVSQFVKFISISKLPSSTKLMITVRALTNSLGIYYARNKVDI